MTYPLPFRPGYPGRPPLPPDGHPEPPVRFLAEPVPHDLYDRLLDRRIVLAHGDLDDDAATGLCAALMTLDALGDDPVRLHLRAPGGKLSAALAVADTIDALTVEVHALATGEVGGAAVGVLAAAHRRRVSRNAVIHLAEPGARFEGTARELAAFEEQHAHMLAALYGRIAAVTGLPVEEVREDARHGRVLTAEQAVGYRLVEAVA